MDNYINPACVMMVTLLTAVTAGCASFPRIVELHDPLTAQEHYQLAQGYERNREFDLALNEYRESAREKSLTASSLTGIGNICLGQGKNHDAEEYYLKAIQADPGFGKAYNNLAWLYISQNRDLPRAEELLNRAVEKDPEHSASYLDTLASLYEKKGDWNRSLEALNRAGKAGFNGNAKLEAEYLKHLENVLLTLELRNEAEEIRKKRMEIESRLP